ncbi:MAG: DNA polymerase IV, partial [Chitinophagales bacterium]
KKAPNFVARLPIEKFFGVGKKTAEKMHKNNIKNGADLLQWNEKELVAKFGKSGKHFFNMARLEDYRPVKPNRIRKSIGVERTFSDDITSLGLLNMKIKQIAQKIETPLKKKNAKGRTITVKIKYNDFEQKTRSKTLENRTNSLTKIIEIAKELLALSPIEKPVRLLGVSISNFEEKSLDKENSSNTIQQLNLDF